MTLVRCILGKFLGVACHCFPQLFRCSHFSPPCASTSATTDVEGELWTRMLSGNFAEMTTSTPFRDLLHAANLRHGTDGFTSPPKEGELRIFFALKNPTASAGVLKASTLPLDHRSRGGGAYKKNDEKRILEKYLIRMRPKINAFVGYVFFSLIRIYTFSLRTDISRPLHLSLKCNIAHYYPVFGKKMYFNK